MVGNMMFGQMVTDKSQSQGIAILMKNLLVLFYVKQKEEIKNEIFR